MGEDEEGTLARLKAIRREVCDPKIKEHRGRIVKTTGDGLLVEFPSVVDAVRCAVEVQRYLALRNDGVAKERRIELRIGINLGDVVIEGGDTYGDGVNVAARLEALAEPGGVCVSRVVREQVQHKVDFGFEDMGKQQVKNMPGRCMSTAFQSMSRLRRKRRCRCPRSPRWPCCHSSVVTHKYLYRITRPLPRSVVPWRR